LQRLRDAARFQFLSVVTTKVGRMSLQLLLCNSLLFWHVYGTAQRGIVVGVNASLPVDCSTFYRVVVIRHSDLLGARERARATRQLAMMWKASATAVDKCFLTLSASVARRPSSSRSRWRTGEQMDRLITCIGVQVPCGVHL